MTIPDPILRILALARWAPSGDNCQPWKFEGSERRAILSFTAATPENGASMISTDMQATSPMAP
jgi:nitroreductase